MSFRLVPKSVTLNDVNDEMALILCHFYRIWLFQGHIAEKWLTKS